MSRSIWRRVAGAVAMSSVALGFTGIPPAGAQSGCPSDNSQVASFRYTAGSRSFDRLGGNVRLGDHLTAIFRINSACSNVEVSFASYEAPGPTFDRNTASQQRLYRSATGRFNPGGDRTLAVDVPSNGFFQVDFVRGPVITQLGPADSNNFYGDQGRLIDFANGPVDGTPVPAGAVGAMGLTGLLGVGFMLVSRRRPKTVPLGVRSG